MSSRSRGPWRGRGGRRGRCRRSGCAGRAAGPRRRRTGRGRGRGGGEVAKRLGARGDRERELSGDRGLERLRGPTQQADGGAGKQLVDEPAPLARPGLPPSTSWTGRTGNGARRSEAGDIERLLELSAAEHLGGPRQGVGHDAVDEGRRTARALEQLVLERWGDAPGSLAEAVREEGVELGAAEAVEGDADDEPALERKQLRGLELGLELGRAGQDEAEQRLGRGVELDELRSSVSVATGRRSASSI